MAAYYTWGEIWQTFQDSEVDLELEDFVDKDEAREWANEAIDEIEAEILTLYEDYFLTLEELDFNVGQDEVPLPENIYAMKIRAIWYKGGQTSSFAQVTSVADAALGVLGVADGSLFSVGQRLLLKLGSEPSVAYYVTAAGATDVTLSDTFGGSPVDLSLMTTAGLFYTTQTASSDYYEMVRIRDWRKFREYRNSREADQDTLDYRYFIVNRTVGSPVIKVTPVVRLTAVGAAEIWYIRNANRLFVDDDICDIPEAVRFIYDHLKVRTYMKEQHPALQLAVAAREGTKQRIIETLAAMVPDAANEIEMDTTHYEDSN
jgi:hypothetical protein